MYILLSEVTVLIAMLIGISLLLILVNGLFKSIKFDFFLVFLLSVIFIFIIVSRTGFGIDEPFYLLKYEYFSYEDFPWGWSFLAIYQTLTIIGVSPGIFNNVIVFLLLFLSIFVVNLINKNRPDKAICLLFLLFTYVAIDLSFNVYRQAFSTLFLILALYFFDKNKLFYFSFSLISIGFHWSATIVFIIFMISSYYTMWHNKNNKLFACILSFLFIIFFFVPHNFILIIQNILNTIPGNHSLVDTFNNYTSYSVSTGNTIYDMSIFGKLPLLSMLLLFILVSCYFFFRYSKFIYIYLFYCMLLMGMAYSFRNFYWILSLYPLFIAKFLDDNGSHSLRKNLYALLIFSYLLVQLPLFFSSGIFNILFKS